MSIKSNNYLIYFSTNMCEVDYQSLPLTIQALEDNCIVRLDSYQNSKQIISYQKNYQQIDSSSSIIVNLNKKDKVSFWSSNFANDYDGTFIGHKFNISGQVKVYGNLSSFQKSDNIGYMGHFSFLFEGCNSILDIKNLYLTEIGNDTTHMYRCCFQNNKNITQITSSLFKNLNNLTFREFAYTFYNCTNLSKVYWPFEELSQMYTINWLYNVSPTGDFYGPATLSSVERGSSTIPSGWTFHPFEFN